MVKVHQAMDSGIAGLSDGSEVRLTLGEVVVKGDRKYEIVLNDLKAQRDNPGRTPLFRELDMGDEEPERKPKIPPTRKST